ncbi:MAG: ribosome-binding factor A [Candidatus Nealsonbacteria bacterium CG08_land_8_20_14_0_20_43_11]|uniref:Ribosome-binding factor A n=1 Tax=Candidatus Nealsonbacteria bacterium CG08_land_8_20_14_0_20_43_11 TaxID=1974706 RepID=A0A2M6T101_9BACT|nr:MAG: ribosome-binding factor A [Candidatus Nealsonbacteria bacterium CG08_land_8_20_14_0_20_43_11]
MRKRVDRINSLIEKELSNILVREGDFSEEALVTITRVNTSANLIQAKVFLSVLPEEKTAEVFRILNRRIYEIQQQFNKRVKMRPVPRLIFVDEKATKEAGRIEELLEKLKKEGK